jgi:hypothetical protein
MCQLTASEQVLHLLKIFLNIRQSSSSNISHLSLNIIFKFLQGMCIIHISSIFVSTNCNLMDSGLEMQEAITCELFTVSFKKMGPVILWEGFVGV